MDDYKTQKEAFVSGMTGSTVGHINLLSCAALVRRPPCYRQRKMNRSPA